MRAFTRVMMIGAASAVSVLLAAAVAARGDLIFSDGFESGDTSAWGGTPVPSCTTCHGEGTDPAPPPDLDGDTTSAATGVGAHQSHLDTSTWRAAIACSECHQVPVTEDDPGHTDTAPPAELVWGALATNDGATPWWDGANCGGVYCHGATLIPGGSNTAPQWTVVDGSEVACGTCHGLPPGAPHTTSSSCFACHSSVDAAGAIIDPGVHIDGVVDVVDLPTISIDDGSVNEGDAGTTTTAGFDVALSMPSAVDVSVDYVTNGVTATEDVDYIGAQGTLTIPAGATTGTIHVTVNGDDVHEADETFTVHLSNPSSAVIADGLAQGTIFDDDVPPTLSIDDVSVPEDAGTATFTVMKSGSTLVAASVNYATSNGTATAGEDFTSTSGTLTFAASDTALTIAVTILDDAGYESDETFSVTLSNPTHASISDGVGEGTILNDDYAPPVALDDAYSMLEGTTLITADPDGLATVGDTNDDGVLANDTDVEGGALTAILDAGPGSGALALDADGTFEYTPNAGFSGSDSFTYFANDGVASSVAAATVTINVTAIDAQPTVTITAPPDRTVFNLGDSIVFEGVADDDEDGPLSDSIEWSEAASRPTVALVDSGQSLGDSVTVDVAFADFDNDGDLDAFAGNAIHSDDTDVSDWVWLNDGSGYFIDSGQRIESALHTVAAPVTTAAVDVGDVNGDGFIDIVINFTAPTASLRKPEVWTNNGLGASGDWLGFGRAQTITQEGGQGIRLGDLDLDGDQDLWLCSSNLDSVWLNDGTGSFVFRQHVATSTSDAALGDVDGDGDLDAFLVNGIAPKIYLNTQADIGDLGFIDAGSVATGSARSVDLGDLDGDGDLDAVLARSGPNSVLLNDGSGAFAETGQSLGTGDTFRVQLADLNGDGHLDIFEANTVGSNQIWLNDGVGSFTLDPFDGGVVPSRAVALGDLDGDGDEDAFVGNGLSTAPTAAPNEVWFNGLMDGAVSLGTGASVMVADLSLGGHTVVARVTDSGGNSVTDSIFVLVNDAPVAADDSASVDEGGSVSIEVLVNDSDGDDLLPHTSTVTVVTDAQNGTTQVDAVNGEILYTHDDSETAEDSFTYTVTDKHGAVSNEATVTITINPVNDNVPVFTNPATVDVPENSTSVMTVTATDADLPAQAITYSVTGGADHSFFDIGAVSGALSFKTPPDYEAPADADADNVYAVEVTADDGGGGVTLQTIEVTVTPVAEQNIVATPTPVDFGNVLAGETSKMVITISNDGDDELLVSSVDLSAGSSADFTVESTAPVALGAGADTSFGVTYTPSDLGSDVGAVEVSSSDPNEPVLTVPLSGGGVEPTLSIDDVTALEGDSEPTDFVFTVTLSVALEVPVEVTCTTSDGTAEQRDSDYIPVEDRLYFDPGVTIQTLVVPVNGDLKYETDEEFTVNLADAVNATIEDGRGVGTITNDDEQPSLTLNDAIRLPEGDTGATPLEFTVDLSNPSYQAVSASWYTSDGTATLADSDYVQVTDGLVTFPPGVTSQIATVEVTGDARFEPDETVNVLLDAHVNATIADGTATGTIANDDAQPQIAIADMSQDEGDSGTTAFTFTVSLSDASYDTVSVDWATAYGANTETDDFVPASGTVTFTPDDLSEDITVDVNGDTTYEIDDAILINLTSPVGATLSDPQAIGLIDNDDDMPVLTINDVEVLEGDSNQFSDAIFTVTLDTVSEVDASFFYRTSDFLGTAWPDDDFFAEEGSLTIPAGDTSVTFDITIVGNNRNEPEETFVVELSAPVNATIGDAQGVCTIIDDDPYPNLSIVAENELEGISGQNPGNNLTFSVNLSHPYGEPIRVFYAFDTNIGTAEEGMDYSSGSSGLLDFPSYSTTESFNVEIIGDNSYEEDESVYIYITKVTNENDVIINVPVVVGSATGWILNDDPPPVITVEPTSFDFGDVVVGSFPAPGVTVTITNDGGGYLYVNSVTLEAGSSTDFIVASFSFVALNAGESTDFVVTYTPSDLGDDTGTIVVTHSDPAQPTVEIPLTGTGVAP